MICAIWQAVWQNWLDPDDRIVCVTGWRSALIDTKGGERKQISCCFWWFD